MFGGNPNERSIKNFPVQGAGSCILRRAIKYCQEANLKVIMPLHDALYIECGTEDITWASERLQKEMRAAFIDVLSHEKAELVRLDVDAWGPNLEKQIYVDERAQEEYQFFKEYL